MCRIQSKQMRALACTHLLFYSSTHVALALATCMFCAQISGSVACFARFHLFLQFTKSVEACDYLISLVLSFCWKLVKKYGMLFRPLNAEGDYR